MSSAIANRHAMQGNDAAAFHPLSTSTVNSKPPVKPTHHNNNGSRLSLDTDTKISMVSWLLSTFLTVVAEFMQGLTYCWAGIGIAFASRHVRALSINSILVIVIVSVITYITMLIAVYIPASILFWILPRWMSRSQAGLLIAHSIQPKIIFQHISTAAPLSVVFTMNNLTTTYERVFLSIVNDLDINLFTALTARQRTSWMSTLVASCRRTIKLVSVAMCIVVLQYIPIIGAFVPALWSVRLAYSLYQLHTAKLKLEFQERKSLLLSSESDASDDSDSSTTPLRKPHTLQKRSISTDPATVGEWEVAAKKSQWMLVALAIMLCAVTYHPFSQQCALWFLRSELACRALVLELFDPYFTRLVSETKAQQPYALSGSKQQRRRSSSGRTSETKQSEQLPTSLRYEEIMADDSYKRARNGSSLPALPDTSVREFLVRNHFQLLGFAAPFVIISMIPLFGLFILVAAHGTAAYFLVQIHQHHERRRRQDLET